LILEKREWGSPLLIHPQDDAFVKLDMEIEVVLPRNSDGVRPVRLTETDCWPSRCVGRSYDRLRVGVQVVEIHAVRASPGIAFLEITAPSVRSLRSVKRRWFPFVEGSVIELVPKGDRDFLKTIGVVLPLFVNDVGIGTR